MYGTRRGSFTQRPTTRSQNGRPGLELSEYIESYGDIYQEQLSGFLTWIHSYEASI